MRLFIFRWPCISLQFFAEDQIDALFYIFIYYSSLHVSSITVLLIRRSNCINTSIPFHFHVWHYSPFRALASLKACLHSSLLSAFLLHPLTPSSCNASLWTSSGMISLCDCLVCLTGIPSSHLHRLIIPDEVQRDALQLLGVWGWRRKAESRDEWRHALREAKAR